MDWVWIVLQSCSFLINLLLCQLSSQIYHTVSITTISQLFQGFTLVFQTTITLFCEKRFWDFSVSSVKDFSIYDFRGFLLLHTEALAQEHLFTTSTLLTYLKQASWKKCQRFVNSYLVPSWQIIPTFFFFTFFG